MPKMFTFTRGEVKYAVNPDRVAFVCRTAHDQPVTRIFFSAVESESDYIEVDEDFDEVHNRLAG